MKQDWIWRNSQGAANPVSPVSSKHLSFWWFYNKERTSLLKSQWCGMLTYNRLPDISWAKMGLFGICGKEQFGVCSHGEPDANPHKLRKENT